MKVLLVSRTQRLLASSKQLLVATDPFYRWAPGATLSLRREIIALQHDIELIQTLLQEMPETTYETTVDVTHQLIKTLSSIESVIQFQISSEGIPAILQQLSAEGLPSNQKTLSQINQRQKSIAEARLQFTHAFSVLWLTELTSRQAVSPNTADLASTSATQLDFLLDAFDTVPYSIGSTSDVFIRKQPASPEGLLHLSQYQYAIGRQSEKWIKKVVKEGALGELTNAHRSLLTLLWNGCAESLLNLDLNTFQHLDLPILDELKTSVRSFKDETGDAMTRSFSPVFSVVFVGAEDSGKSTLLNTFIGEELLPTSAGPTTAYPCRLRHSPGQEEPVLYLGTDYLRKCLQQLRDENWAEKIALLIDDDWDESIELPGGFTVDQLETSWNDQLPPEMPTRLEELTASNFIFESPVYGRDNVGATLRNLNDFIRICQNLPIGFNHFEPADWPIIHFEFPRMQGGNLPDGLEFVDIPGIGGWQNSVWDEVTREIVRKSAIVIALVSLSSFNSSEWRKLPGIVRQGTGVEVGAVVLTKRDMIVISEEEELDWYKNQIRSIFWPSRPSRPIIICSAVVGPSVDALQQALRDEEAKPTDHRRDLPTLFGASEHLAATRYAIHRNIKYAMDELATMSPGNAIRRVNEAADILGFRSSFEALMHIVNTIRVEPLLDYYIRLGTLTRDIHFGIRTLLVLTGVAAGVPVVSKSSAERKRVEDAMYLLDSWNVQAHAFQAEVHGLITRASHSLTKDLESYVDQALLAATRNLKQIHASSPRLEIDSTNSKHPKFTDIKDIERYIGRYQEAFDELSGALDVATAQLVVDEANKTRHALFGGLEKRFTGAATDVLSEIKIGTGHGEELDAVDHATLMEHIQVQKSRYTPALAFSEVQLRVLKTLLPERNLQERIGQLRFVSRSLLAIVSSIPFVLGLPFLLRKWYIQGYTLSIESLRPILIGMAKSQTNRFLDGLETRLNAEDERQREFVQSNLIASVDETILVKNASIDCVQHLIGASANVVGLTTAATTMQNLLALHLEGVEPSKDMIG